MNTASGVGPRHEPTAIYGYRHHFGSFRVLWLEPLVDMGIRLLLQVIMQFLSDHRGQIHHVRHADFDFGELPQHAFRFGRRFVFCIGRHDFVDDSGATIPLIQS
ncbi:MAG TPA: hypothetical protein VG944_19085 [Fimbriimonas sp.]|nr:hypothetical protein [Fimbriimonas sp.]